MAPVDSKLFKLSAPAWRWVIFAGALTAASTGATIALGLAIGTITAQVLGEATPNWTLFALIATAAVLVRVACSYALVRFGQSNVRRREMKKSPGGKPPGLFFGRADAPG